LTTPIVLEAAKKPNSTSSFSRKSGFLGRRINFFYFFAFSLFWLNFHVRKGLLE
jgi:hypothetical protein